MRARDATSRSGSGHTRVHYSHLDHGARATSDHPHLAFPAEYRTVTAVSGPLVILDKVKVNARAVSARYPPSGTRAPTAFNPRSFVSAFAARRASRLPRRFLPSETPPR